MMKNKVMLFCALCAAVLAFCSCKQNVKTSDVGDVASDSLNNPKYAKGYTVKSLPNGVRLVDVADPQKDKDHMPVSYHFALVPKGVDAQVPEGYTEVKVPIERTIVMTMLQMSNFTALDAHDVIKGITGTKNLFDKDILQRVKKGDIVKIGMEGEFDPELILSANPQVIFISPFKRGGYDAIKETAITLIPHLGYKELDPLGQAEWIKYVAMFIGKEKEANQVFAEIESRYLDMKKKVAGTKTRPTVFSGEMHGGNWYAVGGKNYLAQIFRDAGAEYVIKDDNTGGVPIEYEQMYATAANADYWRILTAILEIFPTRR